MSEQKPTTRRRAITIPQPSVEKKVEESIPEVSVENTPAETNNETVVNNMVPPTVQPEDLPEPTEEEWAKQIEEARKAKIGAPAVRATDNGNAAVATENIQKEINSKTNDIIEQEVQRRLELERQKANQAAATVTEQKPPVTSELSDEKKNEIAERNNMSNFVHLSLGDDNDFITAFEREMDEDDRPESERTADPTPYAAGMAVVHQLGQANNQQRLLAKWIGQIMERNTNALKSVEKEMRLARITPKIGDGTGPKKLTGATARAAVISRMKGMYRVQLYNSGFWLDLRPPTLIDIDGWMQSVDTEFKELGRVLGGHAHAVTDVFIKQKFFDILPQLIQRSNFEDYNDKISVTFKRKR